MTRYISNPDNLKLMMNMLKERSRNIQFEAFHVFKVICLFESLPFYSSYVIHFPLPFYQKFTIANSFNNHYIFRKVKYILSW